MRSLKNILNEKLYIKVKSKNEINTISSAEDFKYELEQLLLYMTEEEYKTYYSHDNDVKAPRLYFKEFGDLIHFLENKSLSFKEYAALNDLVMILIKMKKLSRESKIWDMYMTDDNFTQEILDFCMDVVEKNPRNDLD